MSGTPHWWDEIGGLEKIPEPGTVGHTQLLWSLLPHPHKQQLVHYMVDNGKRVINDYVLSPNELHNAVQEYTNDGYNCYIQVNPSERVNVKRSSAKDITHWSWLLIDIDPVETSARPGILLDDVLTRLGMEVGQYLFPTIIYSGRGVQAWFRLEDIPLYDADDMQITERGVTRFTARRTMGWWLKHLNTRCGMQAGCKLDMSVSDLPRVMRMPGTINQDTGKFAMIVRAGLPNLGLAKVLVNMVPMDYLSLPAPVERTTGGLRWQDVKPHLSLTAKEYIDNGKQKPGRHKDMWHTAKSLQEAGCSKEEARKALRWCDAISRNGAGEIEPLGDETIDKTLSQLYLDE